ncbi:uncharacterized protein CIMG_01581 [Coccidioides immitis RS]|uniref:Uncharacterized protein n=1 Tax=Coccidioides immitis (strain RS) TaxID=246410 RepID=J3KJH9_COCIM|nr:uncharacterized protein CIMG_01581 [Coccidioides immitis RS]EAS36227.3 hypothetical protein CIMG_01581 [Coccidioides immitis RS]
MCDYTEVEYMCGHVRYLVKAWCVEYQRTQQRCSPNVVGKETRQDHCGTCAPFSLSTLTLPDTSHAAPRYVHNLLSVSSCRGV